MVECGCTWCQMPEHTDTLPSDWAAKMQAEYEMHEWMDNTTYSDMLQHHHFARIGHPMFEGVTGVRFRQVMETKRREEAQ